MGYLVLSQSHVTQKLDGWRFGLLIRWGRDDGQNMAVGKRLIHWTGRVRAEQSNCRTHGPCIPAKTCWFSAGKREMERPFFDHPRRYGFLYGNPQKPKLFWFSLRESIPGSFPTARSFPWAAISGLAKSTWDPSESLERAETRREDPRSMWVATNRH